MDEQIARWQIQLHRHPARGMRVAYPDELFSHPIPVELKLRHRGGLDEGAEIVEQVFRVNVGGDKSLLAEALRYPVSVTLLSNPQNPAHCWGQAVGKMRH